MRHLIRVQHEQGAGGTDAEQHGLTLGRLVGGQAQEPAVTHHRPSSADQDDPGVGHLPQRSDASGVGPELRHSVQAVDVDDRRGQPVWDLGVESLVAGHASAA